MFAKKISDKSKRAIKHLEKIARDDPKGYEWRVFGLILIGYAYPIILCTGIAILSWNINSGFRKFYAFAIVFFVVFQILFITASKPRGVAIDRTKYPVIFEELDRIRENLKTPKIHSVILSDDVNAAILQAPRLGMFGWNKNYLILGVPLMYLLSPDQFRAVLAHELGHSSGNRSKISVWAYQLRNTWKRFSENQTGMMLNFQDVSPLVFWLLFLPFFKWYQPFFENYAFVLSRNHEYLSDRDAASYAGRENISEALISLATRGNYVSEKYWRIFFQKAYFQAQKPERPISRLIENLKSPVQPNLYEAWLKRALAEKTDYDDTHPCLAERLEMYEYMSHDILSKSFSISAAEYFLSGNAIDVVQQLDEQFISQDAWESICKKVSVEFNYFTEMSQMVKKITPEQAIRCSDVIALTNIDKAIEILSSARLSDPVSSTVTYRLGELLLQQQNIKGVEYIEAAIRQRSGSLLFSHLTDVCDNLSKMNFDAHADLLLKAYWELADAYQESTDRCLKDIKNSLLPHNLPDYEVRQITSFLENYLELDQAFLVKVEVIGFPDAPLFALGIKFKRGVKESECKEILEEIDNLICLRGVKVFPLAGRLRSQWRIIRRVDGSCIFEAG
jgi:Zn-dependent protease with chaperone function